MSDLKTQLIRLGNANPDLRRHLKPVIAHLSTQHRHAAALPTFAQITRIIEKALGTGTEIYEIARGGGIYRGDSPQGRGYTHEVFGPGGEGFYLSLYNNTGFATAPQDEVEEIFVDDLKMRTIGEIDLTRHRPEGLFRLLRR